MLPLKIVLMFLRNTIINHYLFNLRVELIPSDILFAAIALIEKLNQ